MSKFQPKESTMNSLEDRIRKFNRHRQEPTLQLKYKIMAASEFSFFRATCHLFYEDLASHAKLKQGPAAWICGDLHLENFGSYRAANELVYFDINDFDEAVLAHTSWELVRFLCSIGMASELWEYSMEEAHKLMDLALQAYSKLLSEGKAYAIQKETSPPLIVEFFEMAQREKERTMVESRMDKHERLKIINGKTIPVEENRKLMIRQVVNEVLQRKFGYLEVRDVAFRIAGTGSLGVRRYVLLTFDDRKEKWRLLDIKEAHPSSLTPYLEMKQPHWDDDSERITSVQGMMQYALPRYMGTLDMEGKPYVLKQLQPSSQKIDHTVCDRKMKNVETVMTTMAEAVASAQIRSASRKGSASVEELMAFAHLSVWKEDLVKLALEYTIVMKGYFREYGALYRSGKMDPDN